MHGTERTYFSFYRMKFIVPEDSSHAMVVCPWDRGCRRPNVPPVERADQICPYS